MQKKTRWRILAAVSVAGSLLGVLQKPTALLAGSLALYWASETLFGVTPLKPYELGELFTGRPEAAMTAVGTVIAVASLLAFKRAKRLDLELAAGADIASALRDGMNLVTRLQLYCETVVELREAVDQLGADTHLSTEEVKSKVEWLAARWTVLRRKIPQIRQDQSDLWEISNRIIAIEGQHSTVIRARALVPYALWRARDHALALAKESGFLLPDEDDGPVEYLDLLNTYEGVSINDFLISHEKQWTRFLEWMGMATTIGASSVAPPSAINACRMAWQLLTLRD